MSKRRQNPKGTKQKSRINNVAVGMIAAGTGKKQVFKDKREHRAKDFKNSWQKEVKDES